MPAEGGLMNIVEPRAEIEPARFRRVMGRFATGVTVITADVMGDTRGMTANAFMSGSLEPPLCVVSITKRAHMHGHVLAAGRFAVNILAAGQERHADHFAGRPIPGLEVGFMSIGGIPVLADAAARVTADIVHVQDCGDHTLFIGHIRFMEADDRAPLIYHAGHYASLVVTGEPSAPIPEFW
jgi:flavin reductase (DIM6/NTAB) family NADH-FMN oxidoreductase RutF